MRGLSRPASPPCAVSEVPLNSLLRATFFTTLVAQAVAWGSSNVDLTIYGNGLSRDWLYDGSTVTMKLEGCAWGVTEDNEEGSCLEDSSQDGTSSWYQMANCRRAQAVYSLYAGGSCNSGNFKESFITQNGVGEFVYYLQEYNGDNAFDDNYGGEEDGDDYYRADDGQYNDGNYNDLPMCDEVDGYYVGLACTDEGKFSLQYFEDQYCLQPTGNTYDNLRSLNRALSSYKSCTQISSGYNNGEEGGGSLATTLVYYSDTCSSLDSSLCTDNSAMSNRRSHTSSSHRIPGSASLSGKTWLTKLKYVAAGLLLLASFIMFTGILFTNRRRRRALMQRKYRQSRSRKSKSKSRSSRSKSKSKTPTKDKRRRSKSRPRTDRDDDGEEGGVFT